MIKRYEHNPILSCKDIPYPAGLVFNAGVAKYNGRYVMLFRNDYLKEGTKDELAGTNMGFAESADGYKWTVRPKPCWKIDDGEIRRVYDPRITVIDGVCYVCFAADTAHGIRGGIARTDDFSNFEILSMTVPDNRNLVLFPEKIGGNFVRLERPFPVYGRGGRDRFDLWLSESPDLVYWGKSRLVMGVEHVPFANDKIGPAAPPVKTPYGWLTTFHAVDIDHSRGKNGWETVWKKRYRAGVMLLDLKDPSKVIGLCRAPLLTPEAPYERFGGFRNDVIFPGGMILEDNGELKIYYGAADTVECLAIGDADKIIRLCIEGGELT